MVKIYKIILLLLTFSFFPILASAADLYISPSTANFKVGETLTLQVLVSSNSSVNAVSSSIIIPTSFFSIVSVSKASSILNFWATEPNFSNTTGIINLEGVSLNGFSGTSGNIVTIRIKALKAGSGDIKFQSGKVLANDGMGTDVSANLVGSSFDIREQATKPEVEVEIEPKPEILPENETIEESVIPDRVEIVHISPQTLPVSESLSLGQSIIYKYGVLAIIIFIVLLITIIVYQFRRILQSSPKHFSRKVRCEIDETISTVHKSFDILRDDVRESKPSDFRKDLNDAEDMIIRKIRDIESL